MNDQLELRVQSALKSAALPGAPESLREYLNQLPTYKAAERRAWRPSPLLLAATLAMLVLGALSAVYIGSLIERSGPTHAPTPTDPQSPPPSPVATLEGRLLAEMNDLQLVLSASGGTPGSAVSDDATVTTVNLGEREIDGPFLAAIRCWGNGSARLFVLRPDMTARPSGEPIPSPEPGLVGEAPCDGAVQTAPSLQAFARTSVVFTLEVPAGASWQAQVGEFVGPAGARPDDYGSLQGTDGWTIVHDFEHPDLVVPGHGAGIALPAPNGARSIAVTVWCAGRATAQVSAFQEREDVECPTPVDGRRIEFTVDGGEFANVMVSADNPIWVRLLVEADRVERPAYGSPPPMPAALAGATFAEVRSVGGAASYLARGRLGEASRGYVEVPGAVTARAVDDLVVVGITDDDAQRIELWTLDSDAPIGVLVESDAPAMLGNFWIDAPNEQLFYSVWAGPSGPISLNRVGLDGTGQRKLSELDAELITGETRFAIDGSALVTDVCEAGDDSCTRQVIDAETLAVTNYSVPRVDDGCGLLGMIGDDVIHTCFANDGGDASLVVERLDGSRREVLPMGRGNASHIVATSDGPAVLMHRFDDAGGAISWHSRMVETARETLLITDDSQMSMFYPMDVDLPQGWVLFVTSELTDFPGFQTAGRAAPRLVHVVTGDTIELSHLPHDEAP